MEDAIVLVGSSRVPVSQVRRMLNAAKYMLLNDMGNRYHLIEHIEKLTQILANHDAGR